VSLSLTGIIISRPILFVNTFLKVFLDFFEFFSERVFGGFFGAFSRGVMRKQNTAGCCKRERDVI
jgi:hypothetical protein